MILTRRIDEILKIGDDIEVTVCAVRGEQVRIGINAPKSVAVHRQEIAERIALEYGDVTPLTCDPMPRRRR